MSYIILRISFLLVIALDEKGSSITTHSAILLPDLTPVALKTLPANEREIKETVWWENHMKNRDAEAQKLHQQIEGQDRTDK